MPDDKNDGIYGVHHGLNALAILHSAVLTWLSSHVGGQGTSCACRLMLVERVECTVGDDETEGVRVGLTTAEVSGK